MRFRHPRPAEAAAFALVFLAGGIALWACGPFFPNWMLGPDDDVLVGPQAVLRSELDNLAPTEKVPFPARVAEDPDLQTAEADAADLAAALEKMGVPSEKRQALVERLGAFRQALGREGEPSPPVPEGLPWEFEEYLRGAEAWWGGRTGDARVHWQTLLKRRDPERRFRSTWAAFMLGKAALEESNPEEAARWFRRTRELAAEGFADSLGLASSSLGWEGRTELDRGRFGEALRLYLEQHRTGDPSGLTSLRLTAGAAMKKGREALLPLAREADTRQIMTSYVLARYGLDAWEGDPVDASEARAWMEVVREAGARGVAGADRLAWAAYVAGDFAAAQRWLEAAPAGSGVTKWVRARLLLRAGRLEEAGELLAEVSRTLPEVTSADSGWDPSEQEVPLATPLRAAGEEGAVRLARQEYVPALEAFLRGGYELDAAYVAERVLTANELRSQVDARWPAELAARHDPEDWQWVDGGFQAASEARTAYGQRYLLGRRLVREGRYGEAVPYLPEPFRDEVNALAAALKEGRDGGRPPQERAEALFQAACIVRHHGMEIQGTELEPDWFTFSGQYDPEFIPMDREKRRQNKLLPPSADEAARVARHRVEPGKRFHYRYRAAGMAWDAAALLPDGSAEKAGILSSAGTWLAARDPEAANRFYKALVHCCRDTDLGRKAVELRWFPAVEGCALAEEPGG